MKLIALAALAALFQLSALDCTAQSTSLWQVGGEDAVGTELGARVRVFRIPDHLIIIERDAPFLKLVTADGRVRQQIGRNGGGPGEFRQPTAAFFDSTRRELFVVDGAAVRVSVYSVGDSLSYERSLVAPEPGLEAVCTLRGRLFGLVRNSPTMLREFTVQNDRLLVKRAFAQPQSLHPLAAIPALRNEASGSLICDERRGDLVVVSRTLGEVHRIDTEGRRHSIDSLPGFAVMKLVGSGGVFSAEIRQGDSFDIVSNVVSLANDAVIVVARGTQTPQGRRIDGYLSYRVDDLSAPSSPTMQSWGPVAEYGLQVVCLREEPVTELAMFTGLNCPRR